MPDTPDMTEAEYKSAVALAHDDVTAAATRNALQKLDEVNLALFHAEQVVLSARKAYAAAWRKLGEAYRRDSLTTEAQHVDQDHGDEAGH